MIQEIFVGGAGGVVEERKVIYIADSITTPALISSLTSSSPASSKAVGDNSTVQSNLKCPRCDSANTKFCYYNNYNLTQPRHFCKTCRRYWTKGGALRNVPIGGGCRKSKSGNGISGIGVSSSACCKSGGSKLKNRSAIFKPSFLGEDPILWSSTPSSSHSSNLMSFCRETNTNTNLKSMTIKDDFSPRVLGLFDHHMSGSGSSSLDLCQYQQYQQYEQQHNNMQFGNYGVQSSMIGHQELYQRLRTTEDNYSRDQCCHGQINLNNINLGSSYPDPPIISVTSGAITTASCSNINATTSSAAASVMDSIPITSSVEFGVNWNLPMSWNGAFP